MTITPFLDTRTPRKNNLYPIFIRISHGKKQRLIPSGYRIEKKYWSVDKVIKMADAPIINSKIAQVVSMAKAYYADCNLHNKPIRIELIGQASTSHSFTRYLEHRADQYEEKNQLTMARKVRRQAKELSECFGTDLYFDEIDMNHCRDLESFLIKCGNHPNTRADKFEKLRQFFSAATQEGKATIANPFKKYKIVRKPVNREKLTLEEINRIENLELKIGAVNDARNLFLFSYYCKGIRFENCIFCRKSEIKEGRIYFRTNKGNKHISVKIHDRLNHILSQYNTDFIFPYISHTPKVEKDRLKNIDVANVIVNRNLRIVMGLAKIDKEARFHSARHSVAYHLKQNDVSIGAIKDILGHSSTRTTEMYLKSLDDQTLDKEMDKLYGD